MDCWIFDIDGVLVEKVPEDAKDYRTKVINSPITKFAKFFGEVLEYSKDLKYIFTGRKRSEYGIPTELLLEKIMKQFVLKSDIQPPDVTYYPEELSHERSTYIRWKSDNILHKVREIDGISIIIEDDHAVLDAIWMKAIEAERNKMSLCLVVSNKEGATIKVCNREFGTNEMLERIKDVD